MWGSKRGAFGVASTNARPKPFNNTPAPLHIEIVILNLGGGGGARSARAPRGERGGR